MRARRPSTFALAFLLSSAAAGQVRVVPAEAGRAPLVAGPSVGAAFDSGFFERPSVAPLTAPSFTGAPAAAPAAVATTAPRAAALSAPVPARAAAVPAAAAAPSLVPAAIAASAAPARRSPSARPAPASASGRLETTAPESGPNLDALFDGRDARRNLSAPAAGPDRGPAKNGLAPAPAYGSLSRARLARRVRRVALPVAAAAAVAFGAVSPHAAMAVLHGLGQTAYWLANPLAFLFTVPQVHRMLSRRSAEVSRSMTTVGLLSALVTTLCFAFDGKDLMMYRNLAQTLGFAAMLGLEFKYARAPGTKAPSKTRAAVETAGVVLAFTAAAALAGPLLLSVVPATALIGHLLVAFQVLSGFGFTYMMYAQLRKMSAEHSAGDSSAGMMWAYLGTKVIWLWSLATMLSLVSAPVWQTLAAGGLFAGAGWLLSRAVLGRLLRAPWSFLPETVRFRGRTLTRRALGDFGAFVVLSALILGLSAAGHAAFVSFLGVPAASTSLFAMYLLYTVQNLVACVATLKTLRLHRRFAHEAPAR
ncbi:MAG: hypothetical protein KGJ84_11050 [Elusimicrobia bacterium]|nr:hypothetical protein [Elusimicrobiota bacterium]